MEAKNRVMLCISLLVALALASSARAQQNSSNQSLIDIQLANPVYGVSASDLFDLVVSTDNSSVCKYANLPTILYEDIQSQRNFFTPDAAGTLHTIKNFSDLQGTDNYEKRIYVKCKTDTGYINENFPKEISLMVDRSPPEITSAYADPAVAIEKIETVLTAVTSDKAICKFDDKETQFLKMKYLFDGFSDEAFNKTNKVRLTASSSPAIQDMRNYSFYVRCMNRAENISNLSQVNISVDLSVPNSITLLQPEGFVSKNVTLRLNTNKKSTCYYGDSYQYKFPQDDALEHYQAVSDLQEKVYEMPAKCVYSLGGLDGFATFRFTIDSSAPTNVTIKTDPYVCLGNALTASFSAEDTSGIDSFTYKVVDGSSTILVDWRSASRKTSDDINLEANKVYYYVVKAKDRAGNYGGEIKSDGITAYDGNNTNCRQKNEPLVTLTTQNITGGAISITMSCFDSDGTCVERKYCLVYGDAAFAQCSLCNYTLYFSPVSTSKSALFCYRVMDNDNNIKDGSRYFTIQQNACQNIPDGCCNSAVDSVCDSDCINELDEDCLVVPPTDPNDLDSDGMPNSWEANYSLNPNDPADSSLDKDGEGLININEYLHLTDPLVNDTDGDGFSDFVEVQKGTNPTNSTSFPTDVVEPPIVDNKSKDTDGDGMLDSEEIKCGLNVTLDDADLDKDKDGLTNKEECKKYHTNPGKDDTDGDGYKDYDEIKKNSDPLKKSSFPKSHLLNIIMFIGGTVLIVGGLVSYIGSKGKPQPQPGKGMAPRDAGQLQQPAYPAQAGASAAGASADSRRPVPDSQDARKESAKEDRKPATREELEKKIFEKREVLKRKKRDSVFEDFSEQEDIPPEAAPADEKPPEEKKPPVKKAVPARRTVFEKLSDLAQDKEFRKLDTISKKEVRDGEDIDKIADKEKASEKKVQDKLDRLIRK